MKRRLAVTTRHRLRAMLERERNLIHASLKALTEAKQHLERARHPRARRSGLTPTRRATSPSKSSTSGSRRRRAPGSMPKRARSGASPTDGTGTARAAVRRSRAQDFGRSPGHERACTAQSGRMVRPKGRFSDPEHEAGAQEAAPTISDPGASVPPTPSIMRGAGNHAG